MGDLALDYEAFPRQAEAHAAWESIFGYFGGYGSGKTTWLIAEAFRNSCFLPGLPGILASPTYPNQRKALRPVILRLFPHAIRWPRGGDNARKCLGPLVREWVAEDKTLVLDIGSGKTPALRGGTDWVFGSLDDPGTIEGGTYAWGCLDEPRLIGHESWRVFNSRIRDPRARFHRRSVAGVPAMGWMDDEFNRGLPDRRFIRASSTDNPHLPDNYADLLNLSGRRAQAFLHGHFVHLEGTVYETYCPSPVDGDRGSLLDVLPDPKRRTFGVLDFGYRRPAFLVLQDVPIDGGVDFAEVVVAEVVLADCLEGTHAAACVAELQRWGLTMEECYCDPAGDQARATVGFSAVDTYERAFAEAGVLLAYGLQWTLAPVERYIPNGVEATRARFQDHHEKRRLHVARRLADPALTTTYPEAPVGIHRSLLGLHYPFGRAGRSDQPVKDKVNEDFCDALRYYVVNRWGVLGLDEDSAGSGTSGARKESVPGGGHLFSDSSIYSVGGPDQW